MVNPRGDRRARRKARTRRALLDAALIQFAERGIAATRLEDLTEEADLGKGAFYNYFDSKAAVVTALLSEGIDRLDERYLSQVATSGSLAARVASIVRQHDAFFVDHPRYLVLFHQARGLLKLHQAETNGLAAIFSDYLGRLGRLLPPPGDEDAWSEADRTDVAAAVAGAIAGYRSFEIATGHALRGTTVPDILAAGVAALMDARRRPGPVASR